MAMKVEVVKKGAIYDRVRRSARGNDAEGMQEFAQGLANNHRPEFVLEHVERVLIAVINEEGGETRPVDHSATGPGNKAAGNGPPAEPRASARGFVELIYPGTLDVVFPQPPSERGKLAVGLLRDVYILRASLEKQDLKWVFIKAFWLGRGFERLGVLPLEPDVARGQKMLADTVEAGRARGRMNESRDAKIRAEFKAMRKEDPLANDLELRGRVAKQYKLSPERIRQIIKS